MRRPSTTNADADVVISKVFLGKLSHVLVEGGREQEVAMITILVGVTTRHDLGHLLFPVVVKHLIGFIDDGVSGSVSLPNGSMQEKTYLRRPRERT